MLSRDRGGGGAGRAIALQLFCLGRFFRAPDDMDNVRILPLESDKASLLLHTRFRKLKAHQGCEAAVIFIGVPTVYTVILTCPASEDVA